MQNQVPSEESAILPVLRSKVEARRFYDRISPIYGWITMAFERKHSERALELLSPRNGEVLLEIGTGVGYCFRRAAEFTGQRGKCCGVDISTHMLRITRNRLSPESSRRADLYCADAAHLPFRDNSFDGILMTFTLELFDTPEISLVLKETMRVLKPAGRIAIVSLSREDKPSMILKLYEWAHRKWPRYIDCRPIYLEKSLTLCGYTVKDRVNTRMAGLPLETVLATKGQTVTLSPTLM